MVGPVRALGSPSALGSFGWMRQVLASLDERAALVLQTVIQPGEPTQEGVLVESVGFIWLEFVKLLREDPDLVFRLDSRKWEEIMAAVYKEAGFDRVILTHRSHDHGRDWIAEKDGVGTIRIVGQMKRYAPHNKVTADQVRSMLGVLVSEPAATKGIVVTTSSFAPQLREAPNIKPHLARLELVDGVELRSRLEELYRRGASVGS